MVEFDALDPVHGGESHPLGFRIVGRLRNDSSLQTLLLERRCKRLDQRVFSRDDADRGRRRALGEEVVDVALDDLELLRFPITRLDQRWLTVKERSIALLVIQSAIEVIDEAVFED